VHVWEEKVRWSALVHDVGRGEYEYELEGR
jgi:hypothetical protein